MPLSVKAAEPSRPPDASFLFKTDRTWLMGVLNATPDSFYPHSRVPNPSAALQLARRMIREGADLLDIGGASTRPGAAEIPEATERERILPVIDALREKYPDVPLSIDTQRASVAREALARGASLVNDISALRADPAMAEVVAATGAPVVLMHMQGTPQTMQARPRYKQVVDDVKKFFEERLAFCAHHHIPEDRVILDPGIGFGKTPEHNLSILRRLREFLTFGKPLLVGVSRKSFIGRLLTPSSPSPFSLKYGEGDEKPSPYSRERAPQAGEGEPLLPPEERLEGSLAAALWAVKEGASGLRVHDVGSTRRAVQLWEGIARRAPR